MLRTLSILFSALAYAAVSNGAIAQEPRTTAAIYAQFAGVRGEIAAGPVSADIDLSFSDLLDHLDVGGMMAMRNESERWAISFNAVFIGSEINGIRSLGTRYDVDLTQDLVEVTGSWRADEIYELLGGVRFQSLGADVSTISPTGVATAGFGVESFWDPIIGARAAWPIGSSWTMIGRADVGGFGVGSDLTWSALLVLDWSVSPSIGVVLGYRALDTHYEDRSGRDYFKLDTLVAGPIVGMRFAFGP